MLRADATIVQCGRDQPGLRTRFLRTLQVRQITNTAGAEQAHVGPQRPDAAQGVEVRPRVCAHSVERHHDHPLGPPFGVRVATGRIEQATLAAVE